CPVGRHLPRAAQHFFRLDERPIGHGRLPFAERNTRAGVERMNAVQREDCDGLAQLLIKAGHLFKFLWVGHKAGVQLLIASVNIGDHQHHELHRSSPWCLFWSCTLSRLAAPQFDTHPNYVVSSSGSRRSKYRRSGSCWLVFKDFRYTVMTFVACCMVPCRVVMMRG